MKVIITLIMSGLICSCANPNYDENWSDNQKLALESNLTCSEFPNGEITNCSDIDFVRADPDPYRWKQDYKSYSPSRYPWSSNTIILLLELIAVFIQASN